MNNCNIILLVKKKNKKKRNGNKMNTIKLKTNTQDKEENKKLDKMNKTEENKEKCQLRARND